MELGEYLATLRRGWLVILCLAVLGGALAYAQSTTITPTYRSSSTVYVSLTRGETVSELVQGATYTQTVVESFVQLATLPVVLDPVIEELGLQVEARGLARTIQADSPLNTMMIEISAVSTDPQEAADIANAVAASLGEQVTSLSPVAADGEASLRMSVVAAAQPPGAPISPRPTRDAALGLALGTALGVAVVVTRAQLDTRVRTVRDLPQTPGRPPLGQVPLDRALARQKGPRVAPHRSRVEESYRRIWTNLRFLDADKPLRSLVVTASVHREGSSLTAANLALAVAEEGRSVLLVDTDLRAPSLARICGTPEGPGLTALLQGTATLDDVVVPWGLPGLFVLPAGIAPAEPGRLIHSAAMNAFLKAARKRYDLVLLDAAPLTTLTDAAVLARKTDGALVVARSRKVRRPEVEDALASLEAVGATCLGLILNAVPASRSELRTGRIAASHRNRPDRPTEGHHGSHTQGRSETVDTAITGKALQTGKALTGRATFADKAGQPDKGTRAERPSVTAVSAAPADARGQAEAGAPVEVAVRTVAAEAAERAASNGTGDRAGRDVPTVPSDRTERIAPNGATEAVQRIAPNGTTDTTERVAPNGTSGAAERVAPNATYDRAERPAPTVTADRAEPVAATVPADLEELGDEAPPGGPPWSAAPSPDRAVAGARSPGGGPDDE
ncbi:MAG: hypothetical protein JWP95_353 [Actinotalea sp.]|nr:hypothetical protein [Actinotalea sp.]